MPTLALDRNPAILNPSNIGVADRALFDQRLTAKAKLLAYVLARHADEDGAVLIAAPDLLRLCGLRAPDAVIQARRELERAGYVTTDRQSGRIIAYRLLLRAEGVR